MTDYSELKRAAEAVKAMDYPWEHTIRDGRLGKTCTQYARLAHPSNVLALIAENEACASRLREVAPVCATAEQERDKLKAESEESSAVIDQLAKILAGVAVALKGEELPLSRHSYHDLVECVTVLKLENDLRKAENEALRKALNECAASLEGEVLQKCHGQQPEDMHPVTRRDYDRDMAEIEGYKALSKESCDG